MLVPFRKGLEFKAASSRLEVVLRELEKFAIFSYTGVSTNTSVLSKNARLCWTNSTSPSKGNGIRYLLKSHIRAAVIMFLRGVLGGQWVLGLERRFWWC